MEWRKSPERISLTFPVIQLVRPMVLLGLIFLLSQPTLYGQDDQQKYTLDQQKWEQLVKDKSYYEKPPQSQNKDKISAPQISPGAGFLKIFFFGLVIVILVVVLLQFLNVPILGRKVKKKQTFDIFNPDEDDIHEADLERLLRLAMEDGQYKLAIRLYYLIIIRELSGRRLISWKKNKTNREYLNEMRPTQHYSLFRDLTQIFERIWYGSGELNAEHFQKIDPQFRNFIQSIKK